MMRATTDPAPAGVATPVNSVGLELEQLRFVVADIKKSLNGGIAPAFWYSTITPPAQSAVTAYGARVFRSSAQSIPTGVLTAVSFDTERFDASPRGSLFSIGSPTRLTAPVAGLYLIGCSAQWAGSTFTNEELALRINGTKVISASEVLTDSIANVRNMHATGQMLLAANDYVEMLGFQNGAGALNLANAECWMELLNPTVAIQPFNTSAIIIRRTGDIAAAAATPFVPLGSGAPVATHAAARSLVTKPITVSTMFIRLASALAGGGTATFRLNVNGTTQTGLAVVIASGNSTGNATGSIVINDGDFVSLEVTFAGGTVAATIRSATMKYLVSTL